MSAISPALNIDSHVLGESLIAVRAKLLSTLPLIQKVDAYANTDLNVTWDKLRTLDLDNIAQTTNKIQVDLASVIKEFVMFNQEANNPEFIGDILRELPAKIEVHQQLEHGAAKADQTAAVSALADTVEQIGTDFSETLTKKDAEIDEQVQQATAAVESAEEEFKATLAKLVAMSKANPGAEIQNIITMGRELLTKLTSKGDKKGTFDLAEASNAVALISRVTTGPTSLKDIEKQLTAAKANLERARAAKASADEANITRSNANTSATRTAIEETKKLLDVVRKEEGKLSEAWNAMKEELSAYLADFKKNEKENTPDTQRALSAHIHKVTSSEAALKAVAKGLEETAYKL
ncbi:hypothetical protein B0H16DRAFT_1469663 [Mycena metata]|uniref:Uncharacterized protein n=1 Tax=Mycena metata TaxID=1033252 RepID=A0AAD7MSP8_9AGAR|nr:hypothetical protein B0H16DRAFT_1469663 [Mycena metata]